MKKLLILFLLFFMGSWSVAAGDRSRVIDLIVKAKKFYEKGNSFSALATLEEAIRELKNQGKLTIKNVFLCREIYGYQMIKKRDSKVLRAGEPLLVYLEPDYFMVEKRNGKYLVWLSEDARLINEKDKVLLEKKDWINLKQEFLSPIVPIFIQNRITGIPKGKYKLEITLNDKLKGAFASRVIEFSVE